MTAPQTREEYIEYLNGKLETGDEFNIGFEEFVWWDIPNDWLRDFLAKEGRIPVPNYNSASYRVLKKSDSDLMCDIIHGLFPYENKELLEKLNNAFLSKFPDREGQSVMDELKPEEQIFLWYKRTELIKEAMRNESQPNNNI